ncbi:MAG: hypothetical protein PQ965_04840 [Methanobacteriaceae archaeon]
MGVKIEARKPMLETKKKARVEKSKLKWQRREAAGKAAKAKIIPEKIEKPKKVPEVVEKETPEKIKKVEEKPPEKAPKVVERKVEERVPEKAPKVVERKVLIDIEGIGPGRVKKLEMIGIRTIEDLAKSSPKKISEKLNVALKEALRWIKQAKE